MLDLKNKENFLWIMKVGVFITLIWFPFYLAFWPGVGMHDEIYVSQYPKGSTNQPIMYGLYLGFFYKLGLKLFHSHLLGTGLAVFFLMFIMAICVAYVLRWLKNNHVSNMVIYFVGLYYAVTPIIIDYAIAAVKDKMFGVFFMLLVPIMYQLAVERFSDVSLKNIWPFLVVCLGIMWVRNNGYHIYFALICLILFFKECPKAKFLKICIPVLIMGMAPSLVMGKNFTEGLGIPLQQVCRVVALKREIPKYDREFINQMMPIEKIEKQYHPRTVDLIKWTPAYNRRFVDSHKKQFMKTWINLFMLYPKDYFDAWRLNTQGFWGYLQGHEWQSKFAHAYDEKIYTTKGSKVGLADGYKTSSKKLLPDSIKEALGHYIWDYSTYIPSGLCFWITIGIGALLIYRKQYNLLIVLAPAVLCSLTLILAAPIAKAFRYTFYYALCLPLFFILPFLNSKGREDG